MKGRASPDDPALAEYWAKRRRKAGPEPPVDRASQRLLQAQHGRCAICGSLLLHADQQPQSPTEWEQWLGVTRKAITREAIALPGHGPPDGQEPRLVHTSCQRRSAAGSPALLPAHAPSGLA